MSKKLRWLALALVLTLAFSLCAGCAKTQTPAAEPAPAETPAAEPAPAAEETPAAEAPAETPAAEAPAEPADAEPAPEGMVGADITTVDVAPGTYNADGTFTTPCGVSYPMGDGTQKISRWIQYAQMFDEITTYNELFALPAVLEATGVQYVFVEAPIMTSTEQYQLMIASGDYPDLIPTDGFYTGNAVQAFEDEIVISVNDMLEQEAPDYYDWLLQAPDVDQRAAKVEGQWMGLYNYNINAMVEGGNMYRADWLRELGIDPAKLGTLDGLTEVLYAVKEAYDPARTYYMQENGTWYDGNVTWDVPMFNVYNGSGVAHYVVDSKVVSGIVSDNYRAYLEYFVGLYKDGIFGHEFYTPVSSRNEVFEDCANGGIFYYSNNASGIDDPLMFNNEENADCDWEPCGYVFADDTRQSKWGADTSPIAASSGNQPALYITVNCEDPAFVLKYTNFFFAEQGYMLANYGTEGLSYNLNDQGEPVYTDKITGNSQLPTTAMREMYGMIFVPHLDNRSALNGTYSEKEIGALQLWTDENDAEEKAGRTYPTGAALNSAENSQILSKLTDVGTYAQEAILQFMTGAVEITDQTWGDYVAKCDSLGIPDILAVYQTAYDQWAAGER